MAKTKLNIELLKRLKTRFVRMRHPEHFDMQYVAVRTECGTAMCIAGHALQLQGYRFRFSEYGFIDVVVQPDGETFRDSELIVAAKEMGMTYKAYRDDQRDAYDLFHDFSIQTPKQAADAIQKIIDSVEQPA